MKKLLSAATLALVLAVLLTMTGCRGGDNSDVLKYASEADAVVLTGNVADIFRNAGAKVSGDDIKLTPALKRLFNEKGERLYVGLDLEHCAMTMNFKENVALLVVRIEDMGHFRKVMEAGKMHRQDVGDREAYTDGKGSYIVIDEGCAVAFMTRRGQLPQDILEVAQENAENNRLADWKREKLAEGSTLNAIINIEAVKDMAPTGSLSTWGYDPEELANGSVWLRCELKDDTFTGYGSVYNNAGKELTANVAPKKADAKMLEYAPENAVAAMLLAVDTDTDWESTLTKVYKQSTGHAPRGEDAAGLAMISDVLSKLDGTVMLAAGPNSLLTATSLSGWAVTAAANMKDGAAAGYVQQMREGLESAGAEMQEMEGGFRSDWLGLGAPITVKADGNVLLVSTLADPVRTSHLNYLEAKYFDDCQSGLVINLPKDHPVMGLLGGKWGVRLDLSGTAEESRLRLTVTGSSEPLLQTILETYANL